MGPGATLAHHPEVGLRLGAPLICGGPVPPRRLGVVLRDPYNVVVHQPEVVLTLGVPLVGGEAVQLGCLGVVLRDPVPSECSIPRAFSALCVWRPGDRATRRRSRPNKASADTAVGAQPGRSGS